MHVWHVLDGLPSDSVTAIIQTRDGYLWVGSSAGLVRFDGLTFTPVPLLAGSTNRPIRVTALCEDSEGRVWTGTQEDGLFELSQGKMRHFTKNQGLLDDNITSLAAGDHGLVWAGSKAGLVLWNGLDFNSFTTRDGLLDNFIIGVNVARSGTVWVTTRVGMCNFTNGHIAPYVFSPESQGRRPEYLGAYEDRRGNLWAFGDTYFINLVEGKRFNYFRGPESASVRIWSLCEGKDGRLWIGTSGRGLFCFEDNRFQPVLLGENRSQYDVRALCEDKDGNLWLGTSGGGMVQMRPQGVHVFRAGQGLPSSPPTALALDLSGRLCVGVERGGLFVGESGRFERMAGSESLGPQNLVSSLCVTLDGTLWAGTMGDGLYCVRNGRTLHLNTANGLPENTVLSLCADDAGALWANTSAGLVRCLVQTNASRIELTNVPTEAPVSVMVPAASGGLWLGTHDGKVWHQQSDKAARLELFREPVPHRVSALCQGESGRLWVGTEGGGLTCCTGTAELNWGPTKGLPSDTVAAIIEDTTQDLWLSTAAGIYRIKHSDWRRAVEEPGAVLVCKLMSEAKLRPPSAGFGGPSALLAPGGQLWFATLDGLLNVDAHPPDTEPSIFPVCIESAAFNGEKPLSLLTGASWMPPFDSSQPFKSPVDLRSLEFHFTSLLFTSPDEVKFRHKLEGSDAEWVDDGSVRSARYGRLPYGRYVFHVSARNSDGPWQDATPAFVFIRPTPLYLQTWALAGYGLVFIGLIVGTVRVVSHRRLRLELARLEQQQVLERERMRIARDMHDEIGSKLTKISFLSEHAQVDAGNGGGPLGSKIEAIAHSSRELLKTMDEIVWVVNPRNDTLENLAAYLSHYATEYFENTTIACQLRLPPEIPHYPVSSETRHNLFLTFQEALNNALKHSAAETVNVEMAALATDFEVRITDDGKGFELPAAPNGQAPSRNGRGGNGLKNMRQRLAAVGGECTISSQPGKGTLVVMRIRLLKNQSN